MVLHAHHSETTHRDSSDLVFYAHRR